MTKICTRCRLEKDLLDFYRRHSRCIACDAENSKEYRKQLSQERVQQQKKVQKEWRRNNRAWSKTRHSINTYGLTVDQLYSMEDSQDFCCAICGQETQLHVDHNHVTGEVRGLLCRGCNIGLGGFADDPVRLSSAAKYLKTQGHYAESYQSVRSRDIGGG